MTGQGAGGHDQPGLAQAAPPRRRWAPASRVLTVPVRDWHPVSPASSGQVERVARRALEIVHKCGGRCTRADVREHLEGESARLIGSALRHLHLSRRLRTVGRQLEVWTCD